MGEYSEPPFLQILALMIVLLMIIYSSQTLIVPIVSTTFAKTQVMEHAFNDMHVYTTFIISTI